MRTYCEDCGTAKYETACPNCHEEIYIERQYEDLNMKVPDSIKKKAAEKRTKVRDEDPK